MPLFRKRREDPERLIEQRSQLQAELEALEADAAWTAASDDPLELAESRKLKRQADAIRRSVAELGARIAEARQS